MSNLTIEDFYQPGGNIETAAQDTTHAVAGCTCDDGHCWDQAALAAEARDQMQASAAFWRDEPQAWHSQG